MLFLSRGARYLAVPLVRGYVWPYPDSWDGLIAAYYFYVLRLTCDEVLPEYLAWALNGERVQSVMVAVSQGSHMKLISKSDFGSLSIDVPSLAMQHSIMDLHHLALKEQQLIKHIQQKRNSMVNTLCTRASIDNS